jgi:hypothetical protein
MHGDRITASLIVAILISATDLPPRRQVKASPTARGGGARLYTCDSSLKYSEVTVASATTPRRFG